MVWTPRCCDILQSCQGVGSRHRSVDTASKAFTKLGICRDTTLFEGFTRNIRDDARRTWTTFLHQQQCNKVGVHLSFQLCSKSDLAGHLRWCRRLGPKWFLKAGILRKWFRTAVPRRDFERLDSGRRAAGAEGKNNQLPQKMTNIRNIVLFFRSKNIHQQSFQYAKLSSSSNRFSLCSISYFLLIQPTQRASFEGPYCLHPRNTR